VLGRQVAHLVRLVDDLLDVSRITTEKIMLRKEPVDLAVVLARAVETARPHLNERRQRLAMRAPPEPLWVEGDPVRLAQVVANLLANAIKYTGEEGGIELVVERAAGAATPLQQAVIRIKDTGIGIAPEILPRIFELFSQGEQGPQRHEGGLGVGLALVRDRRAHDGIVEAQTQGRAEPVRRPVAARQGAARVRAASSATRRGNPHARRLLVVDDNRTPPRAPRCWASSAMRCTRRTTGGRRWSSRAGSSRTSCCSTSACRE
jgi:signal transduction histidine kinase